jgi:hypothetical protein
VFENIVFWKIFETKKREATEDWRRRDNEVIHNSCSSSVIIRGMSRGM